jgi:hypothetical protein
MNFMDHLKGRSPPTQLGEYLLLQRDLVRSAVQKRGRHASVTTIVTHLNERPVLDRVRPPRVKRTGSYLHRAVHMAAGANRESSSSSGPTKPCRNIGSRASRRARVAAIEICAFERGQRPCCGGGMKISLAWQRNNALRAGHGLAHSSPLPGKT